MSRSPLQSMQESLDSLQRIWKLERELMRARAQEELRRRMGRTFGVLAAMLLIFESIALGVFWLSVGVMQQGEPPERVALLTCIPLLLAGALIGGWSIRRLK